MLKIPATHDGIPRWNIWQAAVLWWNNGSLWYYATATGSQRSDIYKQGKLLLWLFCWVPAHGFLFSNFKLADDISSSKWYARHNVSHSTGTPKTLARFGGTPEAQGPWKVAYINSKIRFLTNGETLPTRVFYASLEWLILLDSQSCIYDCWLPANRAEY